MITKRQLLGGGAAALALPGLVNGAQAQSTPKEIRIGFQKSGVLLIAKAQESWKSGSSRLVPRSNGWNSPSARRFSRR